MDQTLRGSTHSRVRNVRKFPPRRPARFGKNSPVWLGKTTRERRPQAKLSHPHRTTSQAVTLAFSSFAAMPAIWRKTLVKASADS